MKVLAFVNDSGQWATATPCAPRLDGEADADYYARVAALLGHPEAQVLDQADLPAQPWYAAQQRDGVASTVLADAKAARCLSIDARTRAIVDAGFTYAGKTFSLSAEAQMKWTNLNIAAAGLTYPFAVSCIDDTAYAILDAATVQAMYGAAMSAVAQALTGGTQLKAQVLACTTAADVWAVQDSR